MDKLIRDGHVAVLYSPGFGAGWFSWNPEHPACVFDPEIVAAVLDGDKAKAARLAEEKFGEGFYTGGAKGLKVAWLAEGVIFEIDEYDGSESLHIIGERDYLTA